MKKSAFLFLLSFGLLAGAVSAQDRAPGYGAMRPRDMSPEQRQQWREERAERREQRHEQREAWQRMSPEERHQLRQDIRNSGQRIYPRGDR